MFIPICALITDFLCECMRASERDIKSGRREKEKGGGEMTEILGAAHRGDLDRGQNLWDVHAESRGWTPHPLLFRKHIP